jgi:cyclopropane fatty-acyl-phospholipid synthase-like methyltransferase
MQAFGRHVHWGYWENPKKADGSVSDFVAAAENLCQRVCDAASVKDGAKLLDVGCGFGGTIASLNERITNTVLVGLNIDERQLIRARSNLYKVMPVNFLLKMLPLMWYWQWSVFFIFPAGSFFSKKQSEF